MLSLLRHAETIAKRVPSALTANRLDARSHRCEAIRQKTPCKAPSSDARPRTSHTALQKAAASLLDESSDGEDAVDQRLPRQRVNHTGESHANVERHRRSSGIFAQ